MDQNTLPDDPNFQEPAEEAFTEHQGFTFDLFGAFFDATPAQPPSLLDEMEVLAFDVDPIFLDDDFPDAEAQEVTDDPKLKQEQASESKSEPAPDDPTPAGTPLLSPKQSSKSEQIDPYHGEIVADWTLFF